MVTTDNFAINLEAAIEQLTLATHSGNRSALDTVIGVTHLNALGKNVVPSFKAEYLPLARLVEATASAGLGDYDTALTVINTELPKLRIETHPAPKYHCSNVEAMLAFYLTLGTSIVTSKDPQEAQICYEGAVDFVAGNQPSINEHMSLTDERLWNRSLINGLVHKFIGTAASSELARLHVHEVQAKLQPVSDLLLTPVLPGSYNENKTAPQAGQLFHF